MSFKVYNYSEFIKECADKCLYFSVDLEFTGLGENSELLEKDITERHKAICKLVRDYGIMELGITFFMAQSSTNGSKPKEPIKQTFDEFIKTCSHCPLYSSSISFTFTLCPSYNMSISPHSFKFLRNNHMDLNNWIENAIFYYAKGYNNGKKNESEINTSFHSIFSYIFSQKKPLVLHNGWIDLAFLYYTFVGTVATSLNSSVKNYIKHFPIIVDTKHYSRCYTAIKRIYLDYLYEYIRNDINLYHLNIYFEYIELPIEKLMKDKIVKEEKVETICEGKFCKSYIYKGCCERGLKCPASHNILEFINYEQKHPTVVQKKRKVQMNNGTTEVENKVITQDQIKVINITDSEETESIETSPIKYYTRELSPEMFISNSTCHSAGYDSYITGYVFTYFLYYLNEDIIGEGFNKLYLSGKDFPLLLVESKFS